MKEAVVVDKEIMLNVVNIMLFILQIAAFIAEPVMGAGGVMPPPATYWEKVLATIWILTNTFKVDLV